VLFARPILSAVKTRFVGEDLLKGSDINVDCDQHIVTLKGTVASQAGRDRAVELARGTKGVQKVVDRLVIVPKQ
jgi:osmotically-inducible protein OsmY